MSAATSVRLLVVVAHPDDETFACGSLLLHAAAAGAHTSVLCATRGEAGGVAAGVPVPPAGVGPLREAELRSAARLLGVADVHVLDFLDSGMDHDAAPGSLCGAPVETVLDAIGRAVATSAPDVVVTLDASDGHRDHVRVREAVTQVLAGTSTPLYLQCLPRSLMDDWVRHMSGNPAHSTYVELPEIGTPDDELTTIIDTAAHLATRDLAIAEHASQTSPFAGLPEDLRRRFLTREHLVRVYPPWEGGPLERELLPLR